MQKNRLKYFILIIGTIVLGLLSRKMSWLPLATGDALYAVMIYWGFRFLFIKKSLYYSFVMAFVFCFSIEFLQLIQTPFLINARNHSILKLILGQGFLWTDLIAYGLGGSVAYLFDEKFILLKNKFQSY